MGRTVRCFAFVFACGATIAPVGDHFHVARGVTRYLTDFGPVWLGNSPLWFAVVVATFLGIVALLQGRGGRVAPSSLVFLSPLWVGGLYLTTSFFPWRQPGALDLVMALAALATWVALDRSWWGLMFGAAVAAVATGTEWLLVQAGVFEYLPGFDNLYGVASWLLPLYLAASLCVGAVGRRMLAAPG